MNKILFLLNLLILSFTVEAHVNSKTASGANVSWQGTTALSLYLDITNLTTDLSYNQIYNSVLTSTSQYSTNTPMQINLSTFPGDRVGQNTVTFTSQPYFSSGIIAVTQVNYNASTGQISEADIIVNDLYTFTATSGSNYYLSDVITHELGHFLGLSHSEIKDSSMIYTSFNGQATLAQDDINGIKSKYAQGGSTIQGKVVGGSSLIGVFGAHVQAISTQTGKVAGAVISNSDGTFSISNLSSLDSYFIYVSPLKHLDSIPSFYSSINNQICSGSSYRGSYYTKCGDDYKDAPQPVYVSTTSTTNIGKISVRCSFSASLDYLDQKNATSRDARELNTYGQNFTGAVSGIFYSFEKLGPSDTTYGDDFELDLSSLSSPSGKYLDLKFLSQDLFSKLAVSIYVTRGDGTTYNYIYSSSSPQLDTDGNEELARRLSIPLSSTAADNIFDVRLVPISESNMNSTNSLFPSYTILGDSLSHYLLISSISNGITLETFPQTSTITDNSYCAENANVYQVAGFSTNKDQSASASSLNVKQASAPLSCGTIDIDNQDPPTGGPMSFCLGFFALILLSRMKKRFIS